MTTPPEQQFTRFSIRTFTSSMLVLCCALTVTVAVSLQYYLARDKALQSTLSDLQTLSSSVSDYLVQLRERWMLVLHDGEEWGRRKQILYLDKNLTQLRSDSEFSNFVATRRSWFENAREDEVYNSSPYLFHTLKLTGESHSLKVAGQPVVVGVDVLLSSLEGKLRERFVDGSGAGLVEGYIYQKDGRLIASNRNISVNDELPLVSSVSLTPQQQQWVESMPELKVSNQNDWAPLDFEVGGKPYGMAVDLFKLVSEMTGLQFRFINGRSWEQLVSDFESGDIAILQSVASEGQFAQADYANGRLFQAAFALLVTTDDEQPNSLSSVRNSKVALIKGWSIIDQLKQQYPAMEIYEYASLHGAVDALRSGQIDAVLDLESVLKVKVSERFGSDLSIIPIQDSMLSGQFSYFVHPKYQQVHSIIELALSSLTEEQYDFVFEKWNSQAQSNVSYVPYVELIDYAEQQQTNQIHLVPIAGQSQYLFVAQLTQGNPEYLAITLPESVV